MSFGKSINEIASLLVQGGIPSNHSLDIAARLTNAISSYYDSRQNAGTAQEITPTSSKSPSFQRAFRSPEEYPRGKDGAAGKDGKGAFAWAVGEDGKDGADGRDGAAGRDGVDGQNGITTIINNNPSTSDLLKLLDSILNCGWFSQKFKQCVVGGKDKIPGDSVTCKGKSVCSLLDQQGKDAKKTEKDVTKVSDRVTELEKKIKTLESLKGRVDELEKQLADTVNCP